MDSDHTHQQLEGLALIKEEFIAYLSKIHEKIIASGVALDALKLFLEHILPKTDFQKANTVDDIFDLLKEIYSIEKTSCYFFNYEIFEFLQQEFIPNEEDKDLNYPEHLRAHASKIRLSEFIAISPRLSEKIDVSESKLLVKVEFSELAEVLHLKESLASVLGLKSSLLRILDIKEGLVVVTFLIPADELKKAFPHGPTFTQEQIGDLQILSVEWAKVCNGDLSAEGKVMKLYNNNYYTTHHVFHRTIVVVLIKW